MRDRGYYRRMARRKALRKRRISKEILHWDYYDNLHQYSKNKIHCSCPLCSTKTNPKSCQTDWTHGGRSGGKHWKISDLRKLESGKEDF